MRKRMAITLAVSFALICSAAWWSYNTGFADAAGKVRNETLPTPLGSYIYSVAWLQDDRLAFVYGAPGAKDLWDYDIATYSLVTREWKTLARPQTPDGCRWIGIVALERLPDGTLSFIARCSRWTGAYASEQMSLYKWDADLHFVTLVNSYSPDFRAGAYAFSPDMLHYVQTADGDGVNDRLYLVDGDKRLERLLPGFSRAAAPSWSPDGRTIAFFGTSNLPIPQPDPFTALRPIATSWFHPWDLYQMDTTGANLHVVLSGVATASELKWSPTNDKLAFRGEYKGRQGVWILNIATKELTRVSPAFGSSDHDWSPDGSRLVIIDGNDLGGHITAPPLVVDLTSIR